MSDAFSYVCFVHIALVSVESLTEGERPRSFLKGLYGFPSPPTARESSGAPVPTPLSYCQLF